MENIADANFFNASFLFASLLWGSVGFGYLIYGKKQGALPAMIGGILMMAGSYLVSSWLWMSLLSIALMVAVYWLAKQGY
jgi:hypothetical protein